MKPLAHVMACFHCGRSTFHKNVCSFCGWYLDKPFTLQAKRREEIRIAADAKAKAKKELSQEAVKKESAHTL